MTYQDLTINQKISLKEIISDHESHKSRREMGIKEEDDKYFDGLYCLAIIDKNYIEAINNFLTGL